MYALSASALLLTCFARSASAQYYGGYTRPRLTGGAIAGVIIGGWASTLAAAFFSDRLYHIACAAGLFVLLICCTMGVRRRRGAATYLPGPGAGFMRINRPGSAAYNGNMNQGAYTGNAGYQPGYQQTGPQPQLQSGYKPPQGEPAPPPYPGKETYPGQAANNGAPQPGGFAPPPGPPPPAAAHTNNVSL